MYFRHVMVIFLLAQPVPSIGTDRKTQKPTLLIAHREEVLYWGIVKLQFTEKKSLSKNEVLLVNVKNKFEDCSSNCPFLKFIDRVSICVGSPRRFIRSSQALRMANKSGDVGKCQEIIARSLDRCRISRM